jgi:hypothetical protein
MDYPKEVMTLKELVNMGFSKKELYNIAHMRRQTIAWKSGKGGKTSNIYFSTQELEKYRKAKCEL